MQLVSSVFRPFITKYTFPVFEKLFFFFLAEKSLKNNGICD